jgi:hypothetical protein
MKVHDTRPYTRLTIHTRAAAEWIALQRVAEGKAGANNGCKEPYQGSRVGASRESKGYGKRIFEARLNSDPCKDGVQRGLVGKPQAIADLESYCGEMTMESRLGAAPVGLLN